MLEIGHAKIYQHGDSVFLVMRKTKFVAELHLFSEEKSFGIIRNFKKFLIEFWNTTDFVKLEAVFNKPQLCNIVKKVGFKQEGFIEKSYMLPNGELSNEYLYGVSRWHH